MNNFIIRFFLCNLMISGMIGILLAAKHLFRNSLTSRMQYNLWFLPLGLLIVPFLPLPAGHSFRMFSIFSRLRDMTASHMTPLLTKSQVLQLSGVDAWQNDFGMSVGGETLSGLSLLFFVIWITGIAVMALLLARAVIRFHHFKRSALPLQNTAIRRLYHNCLTEMNLAGDIPVYSTAFLKSPVIAGLFRPCIYLPIHLISDRDTKRMRYLLLHELQHYKHKDLLVNYFANVIHILYWFHPFVWYALREMRNDCEIACDTSVLNMLSQDAYADYGYTLIDFAEKLSLSPFPFASGIGGGITQIRKRIINIASYRPQPLKKKVCGYFVCGLLAVFTLAAAPFLSIRVAASDRYVFQEQGRHITPIDLSNSFGENKGSFVLYDSAQDTWQIYDQERAVTRISPVSTYKIYSALFGLESGIITPEDTLILWDGQHHEYDEWNCDQTLESAMRNSVTWYFQAIDRQSDLSAVHDYIRQIGYGNQTINEDLSSYWTDSSLKISPIEQVELLQKFYYNQFDFSPEHIETVKNAICLGSSAYGTLYGKTGTEERDGENISGWFIGYIENNGHLYFFAANIQNEQLATGPRAAELTLSILSGLGIWD